MTDIGPIVQFGFAAVMAVLIWRGYSEIVSKQIDVIERNSKAMESVAQSVEHNTQSLERLRLLIEGLDDRVTEVEALQRKDRV